MPHRAERPRGQQKKLGKGWMAETSVALPTARWKKDTASFHLRFRWCEPAGQPTQDVYGGLQDVLSQQEHPLAKGGGLIRAAETIGFSSLQEG